LVSKRDIDKSKRNIRARRKSRAAAAKRRAESAGFDVPDIKPVDFGDLHGHSKYHPEYCEIARLAAQKGYTEGQIAVLFNVDVRSLRYWKVFHEEFAAALSIGKEVADAAVEATLYQRAMGYDFDAVKFNVIDGKVVPTKYIEHIPPDVHAIRYWLGNRKPSVWRDRRPDDDGGTGQLKIVVVGGLPKDDSVEPPVESVDSKGQIQLPLVDVEDDQT